MLFEIRHPRFLEFKKGSKIKQIELRLQFGVFLQHGPPDVIVYWIQESLDATNPSR